jgi:hypothetical protein
LRAAQGGEAWEISDAIHAEHGIAARRAAQQAVLFEQLSSRAPDEFCALG